MAPFGWRSQQASLADVVRVAVTRLRGAGLRDDDVAALAAYLGRALPAPPPFDAPSSTQAERGLALFRGRAACARCHSEAGGYVDGATHVLGGVDAAPSATPSLVGVAAGGPRFHDGRYGTLGAMLADPSSGMGSAASLGASERDDLLAWLESLQRSVQRRRRRR